MSLKVSCALAPCASTADHIVQAEELGYDRAWCYDSPALYSDVWMTLAVAASRTTRIGVGPAVLVPSLRHPVVTASAAATLHDLAPGRVAVALGAGFSGRFALGHRAMAWHAVATYVRTVVALLRGETAEWEGRPIKLLEREPLSIPILLGADGPKGRAVATELGEGIFLTAATGDMSSLPAWRALMVFGTVLNTGEPLDSPRVWDAAAFHVAVIFHSLLENGQNEVLDQLPGGERWRREMDEMPPETRHLVLHQRHLLGVSAQDRDVVRANLGLLPSMSFTGTAEDVGTRIAGLAASGVTEVVYQPCGVDIPGELERFMSVARDAK